MGGWGQERRGQHVGAPRTRAAGLAELKPTQIWSQSLPAGEPGGRNKPDTMEGEERQAR